ncbi:GTPase ObgE [Edaphobacter modestus]|uniref:GTPase Obg n=1 Tax=Edaphobacter modestus TaxID=388466 RepID=A0A4Q7YV25_9BACT|nr:GTPase ObgE [Edaphobacter modestus]RZU41732.1 GTP-binding protein [Edaphobacter modestus]
MFIDEAKIRIKAGDGGNGCMAFRREKFVPRGGPSGGDGGHGGDILMTSSLSHNTLVHFRFNPEHKSGRGEHGMGSNMSGHAGDPLLLQVPIGTLVYDEDTGELVHDFTRPNETVVVARGGRGGRGNQHFATSTHQAPREHELGRPGEERHLRLELRLLADAGLVGYPNVGKSTLISRLSAARPKIANYAFTTLEPNLGVVKVGDWPHEQSFTIADLPGLIEGAHLGAGLGVQFLKHIERTSVIVHLVDVSDASGRPDPVDDFKVITAELASFDPELPKRPTLLVASKADVANPDKLKKLTTYAKRRKIPLYTISAVTGEGIEPLKYAIAAAVAQYRPVRIEIESTAPVKLKPAYPPPAASARRSKR